MNSIFARAVLYRGPTLKPVTERLLPGPFQLTVHNHHTIPPSARARARAHTHTHTDHVSSITRLTRIQRRYTQAGNEAEVKGCECVKHVLPEQKIAYFHSPLLSKEPSFKISGDS
jgi:hypothetical protein